LNGPALFLSIPACRLSRAVLLAFAAAPDDLATLAFAGVVGGAWERRGLGVLPLIGVDARDTQRLMRRYFPGAAEGLAIPWELLATARSDFSRDDEIEDLLHLLLDHRTRDDEETRWVAHAVATACMGEDHLWQDMGLPSRAVLSQLLERYFTALFRKNTGDMKWKKFFYKQLCDRAELFICKSPSCGICIDYRRCFGPEDK
jgi:nitrogen fixation protein NifQ